MSLTHTTQQVGKNTTLSLSPHTSCDCNHYICLLSSKSIHVYNICTFDNQDIFWCSYRHGSACMQHFACVGYIIIYQLSNYRMCGLLCIVACLAHVSQHTHMHTRTHTHMHMHTACVYNIGGGGGGGKAGDIDHREDAARQRYRSHCYRDTTTASKPTNKTEIVNTHTHTHVHCCVILQSAKDLFHQQNSICTM